MGHDKEYVATICLGATTPSYDLEKEIDATYPYEHITREQVEGVLSSQFLGEIEQVPPMFSAIRIDGKRAYEYARKGDETVELKSRKITIREIEILDFNLPYVTLRVVCSKGTYIRSIARDLGVALGSGGHLTALRRTAVGDVKVEDTQSVETFISSLEEKGKTL
jgi:tRNA pseudouridine55 synthase